MFAACHSCKLTECIAIVVLTAWVLLQACIGAWTAEHIKAFRRNDPISATWVSGYPRFMRKYAMQIVLAARAHSTEARCYLDVNAYDGLAALLDAAGASATAMPAAAAATGGAAIVSNAGGGGSAANGSIVDAAGDVSNIAAGGAAGSGVHIRSAGSNDGAAADSDAMDIDAAADSSNYAAGSGSAARTFQRLKHKAADAPKLATLADLSALQDDNEDIPAADHNDNALQQVTGVNGASATAAAAQPRKVSLLGNAVHLARTSCKQLICMLHQQFANLLAAD